MGDQSKDSLQGGHISGKFCCAGKPLSGGNYRIIVFLEPAVITSWTDTNDIDQKALWNIGGETIAAGAVLFAHNLKGTKTLVLASGSALGLDSMD